MFLVDLWKWFHYSYIYAPRRMKQIQAHRLNRKVQRLFERGRKTQAPKPIVPKKVTQPTIRSMTLDERINQSYKRIRMREKEIQRQMDKVSKRMKIRRYDDEYWSSN
jgi:hypothetical protein